MTQAPTLSDAQLQSLPIFPLPGLVFFPDTRLPLHIFEPRYREMIAWCITHDAPLGVVMIRPGFERDQPRDPPVLTVLGVGQIVRHQRLADGRYNVVLQGVSRARLLSELPSSHAFRLARCVAWEDAAPPNPDDLLRQVQSLRAITSTLAQRWPAAAPTLSALLTEAQSPSALINGLASVAFAEPIERQSALECERLDQRGQLVLDRMLDLLAQNSAEVADA
ncbi:LON peptidase substrate-binding domain-containing protein [Myxococcota bacterium]|nr:LON peptidase substrate-binding domain-containing protein [Myxococcota bacterium]